LHKYKSKLTQFSK